MEEIERRIIDLILNARIETDEDYIALARLIDDEASQIKKEQAETRSERMGIE